MDPSRSPTTAAGDDAATPHRPRSDRGLPAERAAPPMRRILIVDDSRVTRELMKVYLIARDVELLEAADGFEAIDLARTRRPDLVLADVRMPRLDGFGLCSVMRNDPALARIPILFLTSARDTATEARLRAAGACEVLRKPIQPEPLLHAVRRHLPPAHRAGRPGAPRRDASPGLPG